MTREGVSSLPFSALHLAQVLPESVAQALAAAIEQHNPSLTPAIGARIVAEIAQPEYRAAAGRFLRRWAAVDPEESPIAVAAALRTAACAVSAQRAETSTELVWTGPNPDTLPLRRTDQALLEVIDAAQQTLTIVTFAAYKVPAVADALVRVAQRGVHSRIIIESAQASEGKIAYEAINALGPDVSRMAVVYVWPMEKRPVDATGRHGSLHAKCAVADDTVLFVSSANLTAYALTLNMELGVLIRGGNAPRAVAEHFTRLIQQGILESTR